MPNKKIVVITGAGISADSGLSTFRDSGGLWEGYNIDEVASIEGWINNPKKVLDFYNLRRIQASKAVPNNAHLSLKKLEGFYEVVIITQNVDDLHERAGSSKILHLHGELTKARSEIDENELIHIGANRINLGDLSKDGSQLRPAIVWFGEWVPMMEIAIQEVLETDYLIVVGTSLAVYPAASLIHYVADNATKIIIDPVKPENIELNNWEHVGNTATKGVPEVVEKLINEYRNEKT